MNALATDTKYAAVDYIPTYTGRAFHPRDPKTTDVSIIDIAHGLSNLCRWNGACETFYSVAQHCCLLADYVAAHKRSASDCLQMLLHDASEAYLADVTRPVKQHLPDYRQWEFDAQMCVRKWAGLGDVPIPAWQDDLDSRIIADERAQLMPVSPDLDYGNEFEPLGIDITPWANKLAEQQFLLRYARFTHAMFGTHQYLRSGWGISTDATFIPFRTLGSDVPQWGEPDATKITDLVEVDLRGNVGRVVMRSQDGMMMRDTTAGQFPRPAWRWQYGHFQLLNTGVDNGLG